MRAAPSAGLRKTPKRTLTTYPTSTHRGRYGLDSIHGAGYVQGATILPHQLSIAATFSRARAKQFGYIAGKDTLAAGIPWLFSPILGLGTNPLWPRLYETFGEDPKVVTELGTAVVLGIQSVTLLPAPPPSPPQETNGGGPRAEWEEVGWRWVSNDSVPLGAAACAKHFIGYSSPRSGHDRTPVFLPMRELQQYYVPPWRAVIDAGIVVQYYFCILV